MLLGQCVLGSFVGNVFSLFVSNDFVNFSVFYGLLCFVTFLTSLKNEHVQSKVTNAAKDATASQNGPGPQEDRNLHYIYIYIYICKLS